MRLLLTGMLVLITSGCGFQVVHCPLPGGVPIVPEGKGQLEARRAGDGRYSFWAASQDYITIPDLEERFRVAEEEMEPPRVQLLTMDPDELRKFCIENLGWRGEQMATNGDWMGFSYYDSDGTCVVVAPRPRTADDFVRFAVIGHELTHCHWGLWHSQEDMYGIPIEPPIIRDHDELVPRG